MTTEFGTQLIGQTEKALNAILDRQLAGTGITEPQWVTLTLTVRAGAPLPGDTLAARVAAATKVDRSEAHDRLTELTTAGLIQENADGTVTPTERGKAQWTTVRASIETITADLWGDLPAPDLTTAATVLTTVLQRANTLLSA
ncbi:hypothetical protein [Dactylosporangium sp. CA-139066]|uniref:hypothetical protein n=1 Tax=Dactylosporangium sp. CA-139066 TaxID=3239930 RepID=UPI003D8F7909